jgi:hypothetical protein
MEEEVKPGKNKNFPEVTASVATISALGPMWGLSRPVDTDRRSVLGSVQWTNSMLVRFVDLSCFPMNSHSVYDRRTRCSGYVV